ncbi:MAG: hypothetical protein WBX22_14650, partial [Silvibacterium sp.]
AYLNIADPGRAIVTVGVRVFRLCLRPASQLKPLSVKVPQLLDRLIKGSSLIWQAKAAFCQTSFRAQTGTSK